MCFFYFLFFSSSFPSRPGAKGASTSLYLVQNEVLGLFRPLPITLCTPCCLHPRRVVTATAFPEASLCCWGGGVSLPLEPQNPGLHGESIGTSDTSPGSQSYTVPWSPRHPEDTWRREMLLSPSVLHSATRVPKQHIFCLYCFRMEFFKFDFITSGKYRAQMLLQ